MLAARTHCHWAAPAQSRVLSADQSSGQWLHLLHPSIGACCRKASTVLWPAAGQSNSQALELRKACQLNTSMCLLQLQRWGEVVPECNAVISVEPQNRKALYRRGQALHALGRCVALVLVLYVWLGLASAASTSAVLLWCCWGLTLPCLQGLVGAGSCHSAEAPVYCMRQAVYLLPRCIVAHEPTGQLGWSAEKKPPDTSCKAPVGMQVVRGCDRSAGCCHAVTAR